MGKRLKLGGFYLVIFYSITISKLFPLNVFFIYFFLLGVRPSPFFLRLGSSNRPRLSRFQVKKKEVTNNFKKLSQCFVLAMLANQYAVLVVHLVLNLGVEHGPQEPPLG